MSKKHKSKKLKEREIRDCYQIIGHQKISINELREQVNAMDKEYGIRLKHPDAWHDPKMYLERLENNVELNIKAIICTINGINPKLYLGKCDFNSVKQPKIEHKHEFSYYSVIDWDNTNIRYSPESLTFRCRFVTLVLMNFIGNIRKITNGKSEKKFRTHHSYDERKIRLTKNISNDCMKFTEIMIHPGYQYQNIILKMHDNLAYTKKKTNQVLIQKEINGEVMYTRKYLVPELWSGRPFYDDDLGIYHTLRGAFMLATNIYECNNIPKFKHVEGATTKHDLLKLIESLGEAILEVKEPQKFAPMFKAFVDAQPSIWTEYKKESDENLAVKVGIYALSYMKFVYNNKYTDKFINQMLKKGI